MCPYSALYWYHSIICQYDKSWNEVLNTYITRHNGNRSEIEFRDSRVEMIQIQILSFSSCTLTCRRQSYTPETLDPNQFKRESGADYHPWRTQTWVCTVRHNLPFNHPSVLTNRESLNTCTHSAQGVESDMISRFASWDMPTAILSFSRCTVICRRHSWRPRLFVDVSLRKW